VVVAAVAPFEGTFATVVHTEPLATLDPAHDTEEQMAVEDEGHELMDVEEGQSAAGENTAK
jgi:hypothetical protein